jgi:thioredoxin reductase/Pyruvate/2-oxoacid:ferredoxin oxidoreductase delta subunit
LCALVCALGLATFALISRRKELAVMERAVRERDRAVRRGSEQAQLAHPVVDLSRCLGCGTCVAACPEEGVLEPVHGQAMVVNAARCMGHSACERECPVGAITVTIANLESRRDVPVLTEGLEAVGSPGLFLAGEVTAHALIKTAIEHGTRVAGEVARRAHGNGHDRGVLDLCIVGAGPAGLACSLEAKRNGLSFVTLDQEAGTGGTVAKYPRHKLVLTEPVELPIYGRLAQTSYTKEELVSLWQSIAAEQELPIRGGEVFAGLEQAADGAYLVHTQSGAYAARHVCLALGRRGTPRRLEVPGEELPKVAYSLLDANSYRQRRILVVGGGDSAVETAVGLAEQPGNQVTLSYRKEGFFRIRSRTEQRLNQALARNRLSVLFQSEVSAIGPEAVELQVAGNREVTLPNDDVFVMAGGVTPFELLASSGVSFDPALREPPAPIFEQGTGLARAIAIGFALSLATLLWALWHADYYLLPAEARPAHAKHVDLRPGMGFGLWAGVVAVIMIGVNLLYLVRRAAKPLFPVYRRGSLQAWMTSHVATGIGAFLCALLHSAMAPRDTNGGNALWALAFLLVTGAIGRYFYSYVPRAANGRELELDEAKRRLAGLSDRWDPAQRDFGRRARDEVLALIHSKQWKASFAGRVWALVGGQRDLRRVLTRLAGRGREEGVPEAGVRETVQLARSAHRLALSCAHYEDLRAVAGTWRYLHRWVAVLMVVLIVMHVFFALAYGAFFADGGA